MRRKNLRERYSALIAIAAGAALLLIPSITADPAFGAPRRHHAPPSSPDGKGERPGRNDDRPGHFSIVADNLNNPRQITIDGGSVYVAEAGLGGPCDPSAPDQPCIGFTSSVTRVRGRDVERVQSGLISVFVPGEGDVVGVDAVTRANGQLLGVATGACAPFPLPIAAQAGKVLRLEGGTSFTAIGDVSSVECTLNPDGFEIDSDPYGIAARGDTVYVADAAGNDIIGVRNGQAFLVTLIPSTNGLPIGADNQPVPTSLAFGPDGALYIGTLAFAAGNGGAKIYRLDLSDNSLTEYARGLTAVTAIAFDRRGRLYASEFTTDLTTFSPDGAIAMIPNGGHTPRRLIGTGLLHYPGGVATMGGNLFVSNWSIAPGTDGQFGPGNHGQLLRFNGDD